MPTAEIQVSPETDLALAEEVANCYADPLRFVRVMYPWGEPGTALEHMSGPDTWQVDALTRIGKAVRARKFNGKDAVAPIRIAVSSGHGIGKSTLQAWLVDWIMCTRPRCRGTVTANTQTQLDTKTWAAVMSWTKLCLVGHWFESNTARLYRKGDREGWFCAPQSSKEENSEAFAGQHANTSTSFYVIDEGSAVPDIIYEVAEGGLTDGEPMIFVFGNCTRSTGRFHQICFGSGRRTWDPIVVDARSSKLTNKALIEEWISEYGEDSDFVRVRVLGLPPNASDAQFIDHRRIQEAQTRQVLVLPDEPLVAGCDLAWGGSDDNVIRFRRGADARSIPSIRIKGELTRDPAILTARLADVLTTSYSGKKVAMLFLDSAGIAGPIGARLRAMGYTNVQEVNFGADSPDRKFAYYRDYMWGQMREWLATGAIDSHPELEIDLGGPSVVPDVRQRVKLESKEQMKKRGLDSPDDGDALALTFAAPVGVGMKPVTPPAAPTGDLGWMSS